jgi:hypothetical protein
MIFSVTVFGCKLYQDVAILFEHETKKYNNELLKFATFFSDKRIDGLNITQSDVAEGGSWSHRVAESLEMLDDDYVLFLLDDYFIYEKINFTTLTSIVDWCSKSNVKYCRLINTPYCESFGNLISLPVRPYSVNLQPAIWERDFLISILRSIDSNPWETEVNLHKYFTDINGNYCNAVGFGLISGYLNAVIKGKWARDVPVSIINKSTRLRMSLFEWNYYRFKSKISSALSTSSKQILKMMLRFLGFKFFS